MKVLLVGYLALLLGVGCGGRDAEKNSVVSTGDLPGAAIFADSNLEAAVRQALSRPTGTLDEAQLQALEVLDPLGKASRCWMASKS